MVDKCPKAYEYNINIACIVTLKYKVVEIYEQMIRYFF